jgi:hypothetical protein
MAMNPAQRSRLALGTIPSVFADMSEVGVGVRLNGLNKLLPVGSAGKARFYL